MILLDVDDRRSIDKADDRYHGQTIRLPELSRAAAINTRTSEVWSLPDYDTSQQQHTPVQASTKKPSWFALNPTFWRATLFALFIYVAVSIAIAVPLVTKLRSKKEAARASPYNPNTSLFWTTESDRLGSGTDSLQWLAPWEWKDGKNTSCDPFTTFSEFSSGPNATIFNTTGPRLSIVSASFELPPGGLLAVRSNFSYSSTSSIAVGGNLTVDVSTDDNRNFISFFVRMNTTSRRVKEQTRLCFNAYGPNRGLTIYTPDTFVLGEQLFFDIFLVLPKNTHLSTFLTYLPQIKQTFGDLMNTFSVTDMVVEGALAPISFRSIGADSLSVKNILAPIRGTFNVTNDLSMDVIEGSINSSVTLLNVANISDPRMTRLSIANGDSPLSLNVTLASSGFPRDDAYSGGDVQMFPSFSTQIQSYNGPIDVTISHGVGEAPAALKLQIQNALASTNVKLDDKFQGRFDLQTRLSQVNLVSSLSEANTTMPAETETAAIYYPNRTLTLDRHFPDRVVGYVGWDPQPSTTDELSHRVWGSFEVRSSRFPVTLQLP